MKDEPHLTETYIIISHKNFLKQSWIEVNYSTQHFVDLIDEM